MRRRLTVPESHSLNVARAVMKNNCVGALVLGPFDHVDAAFRIEKLTDRRPKLPEGCDCEARRTAKRKS
jgi:hypothetical protein